MPKFKTGALIAVLLSLMASLVAGLLVTLWHPTKRVEDQACTGSMLKGTENPLRRDGDLISTALDDRKLRIPRGFLSWMPPDSIEVCHVGGDTLYAQFWFPGMHPTKSEFWYRNEAFVESWSPSANLEEQAVVKADSIETYDASKPSKFNSARRRIDNALKRVSGERLVLKDDIGLKKLTSAKTGEPRDWISEDDQTAIFISCLNGGDLCFGFVDFKDLGISVRMHFSERILSRNAELVASLKALLQEWSQ